MIHNNDHFDFFSFEKTFVGMGDWPYANLSIIKMTHSASLGRIESSKSSQKMF